MAVKIRLARIGKKHVPFYRIVAIDTRKKRDGQNLANLGTYDPMGHKLIQFKQEEIDQWISKGAQMTETVQKLQKMFTEHGLNKSFGEAPKKEAAPKVEAAPKKEAAPKVEEAPKKEAAPKKEEAPKVEAKDSK